MKRRIMIVLALMGLVLLLGESAPALAGSHRKITGGAHATFEVPDLLATVQYWGRLSIHEVDPGTGEARGSLNVKEYWDSEIPALVGWRRAWGHAICVAFDEDIDGNPVASYVIQIDRIRGVMFEDEEEGQYWKFWVRDGGTPASEGDEVGIVVMMVTDQPDCGYAEPFWSFPLEGGNLVIHTYD